MSLSRIPSPEESLSDLANLLPTLYAALEHGVFEAKEHFQSRSLKHEPSAFSTLVRLHAKDHLLRQGVDAFEVEDVNLCGLSLQVPRYWIKIWKSEDDNPPAPGASATRKEFYQQPLFPVDGTSAEPVHLAVLWNLDNGNNLSAVWLTCPESADQKSTTCYWQVLIPHPATSVHVKIREAISPDLPMKLKMTPASGSEVG